MGNDRIVNDERFRKFGTVSFTSRTKVNDFINYLEDGIVAGTQCKICGKKFFPPRADCYSCFSSDVNWFYVEGYGKLVSYSMLNFAPKGFECDLPYILALLDFDDYKIFGRIDTNVELSEVVVGMKMVVSVNSIDDDRFNYVFRKI